ncbi:hypothetical protein Desde_0879 [Desulfitobacterium dehalogenans ATCC 51507]|uniref:Uncharacterized protein n=1 Tax=Desulfitobacterium dehalogenans (strain ATCC 51507 / DSM 9161 / JW/IU-DC1) TaxID=756499 RepID=I4A5T5_DESDJ|nr:hypothetical protein Desde_0879 [Desulfitobacterium dehalogenans ATCC 51507]
MLVPLSHQTVHGLLSLQNLSLDFFYILLFCVSHVYPVHLLYPKFHLPVILVSGELATKSYKCVKIAPIPNPRMDTRPLCTVSDNIS